MATHNRSNGSSMAFAVLMLLISAGVHLVLWPFGNHLLQLHWSDSRVPKLDRVMEVALLPESEQDKRSDPTESGQLVKMDRIEEGKPPPDTKYLSEFDNRVERETRARLGPAAPANPQVAGQQTSNATSAVQPLPLGPPPRDATRSEIASDRSDSIPIDESGSMSVRPPTGGGYREQLMRGAKLPQFARSGSYDDLDGLEEDDETSTNSKRWKYASFFNRVRDAVAEHWHPEVVHASRDPDRRIHGTQTRKTRLFIKLNPDGSVNRIKTEQPSGVDYLDEEAIRAVRAAQPFINPPRQLIDSDSGLIEFSFGFIFEIDGRRRIFRYRQ